MQLYFVITSALHIIFALMTIRFVFSNHPFFLFLTSASRTRACTLNADGAEDDTIALPWPAHSEGKTEQDRVHFNTAPVYSKQYS